MATLQRSDPYASEYAPNLKGEIKKLLLLSLALSLSTCLFIQSFLLLPPVYTDKRERDIVTHIHVYVSPFDRGKKEC